uniref:Uncharacterized protein n=1 Tax=viral metagenome TaxID=1070528 RepID=A0A6C0J0D4_9ZZZZ
MVVHAVGEAQVLAHVLPEGHGVTRDLEVVQLATPTVAGVKEATFGHCTIADCATVEYHNDMADQLFGEVKHEDRWLDVLMVHGATSRVSGHDRCCASTTRENTT